jgi:hypothetical protein
MNNFKVSETTAFTKLYDSSNLLKYASDDNLINVKESNEFGHYLFCYGSNSLIQLKKRLNKKNFEVTKAYLPNYVRIFSGHSNKWNGGTASIIKASDNFIVKGTLIYLYESDLKKLDKFEGAHKNINPFSNKDNIYRRSYIKVKNSENQDISCITYIKNNHNWMYYPSDEYLEAIKINMSKYWEELDDSKQLYIYDKNLLLKGVY